MSSFKILVVSTVVACLGLLAQAQDQIADQTSYTIDINLSGQEILNETTFSIMCSSCTVHGDLSLSAGDEDEMPNANFSDLPFKYQQPWAAAVLDNFVARFEFDVILTPTEPTNELDIPLIHLPEVGVEGITFPVGSRAIGLQLFFNPKLHGWVNASTPVEFKYGFEFTSPSGTAIFVNVDESPEAQESRFNESSIKPLEFTSPNPIQDDFTFELAFRPIFGVGVRLGLDLLSAEVFADVPQLDVNVTRVSSVTSDCMPAASGTPEDQTYDNLTRVVTTLGFDWGWAARVVLAKFGDEYDISNDSVIDQQCLEYSVEKRSLIAVANASNSGAIRKAPTGSIAGLMWTVVTVIVLGLV